MLLNPFTRRSDPHLLAVSMTGVKMGDRVAFVGCAHGGRLAAMASKVGLSGRAVAIVPDEPRGRRWRGKAPSRSACSSKSKSRAPTALPLEDGSVDLAVVDDTAGFLGAMPAEPIASRVVRELVRILRPGRARHPRRRRPGVGSRAGWWRARPPRPSFAASGDANPALAANGFGIVRTLAEREGLVFVEGIKPRA